MAISQKRQAEIFRALEHNLHIQSMRVRDFNYWPIVRFAINYHRKYGTPYTSGEVPESLFDTPRVGATFCSLFGAVERIGSNAVRKVGFVKKEPSEFSAAFEHIPRSDVVFWTRAKQHVLRPDGRVFHPVLDSLRDIIDPELNAITMLQGEQQAEHVRPVFQLPKRKDLPTTVNYSVLRPTSPAAAADRNQIRKTIASVNGLLNEFGHGLRVELYDILSRIDIVIRECDVARAVLVRARPKVVLLTSFTGAYYVCMAGHQLRIPVVDIQHGGSNQYHFAATGWHNLPSAGYEALPRWFWCWTSRSASYVQFPDGVPHGAVVGGNPKLAVDDRRSALSLDGAWQSLAKSLEAEARPVVVVALQYGRDALLPQHVLDFQRANSARFRWVFRLHPMGGDRRGELERATGLSENGISAAMTIPLAELLKRSNFVLTKSSTIVHEADAFGVRPIVWSHKGAELFDDLVKAGVLDVALDGNSLGAALSKPLPLAERKAIRDELTNPDKCRALIEQFVSGQRDYGPVSQDGKDR